MTKSTTIFLLLCLFIQILPSNNIHASLNAKGNVDVTFQVDMQNQTVAGNVHLAGNFASAGYSDWTPADIVMTLKSGAVYETTLSLPSGLTFSYKFVNGDSWEQVPSSCNTDGNRTVTINSSAQTIDVVCFGSCDACQTPIEVTFNMDMSNETISANGVYIAGNFGSDGYAEWDPAGIELSDIGNSVYSTTLNLTPNKDYSYKVLNGNTWNDKETDIGSCAEDDGYGSYNRTFSTTTDNLELPAYYFNSCDINSTDPVDVTFNVNMKKQMRESNFNKSGDVLKLEIEGDTEYTMTDTDNDSVFSYVLLGQTPEVELGYRYKINTTVESNYSSTFRNITPTSANNSSLKWYNDEPVLKTITFQVNMSKQIYDGNFDAANHTIEVLGNFTNWQSGSPIEMINTGSDNIFQAKADLPLGDLIEYKFRMIDDANVETWESRSNREYTVAENNPTQLHWFNDETLLTNVVFYANMIKQLREGYFDKLTDKLYLDYISAKTQVEMTDTDGDSIYTTTLTNVLTGTNISYNYHINAVKESVDSRSFMVKATDNEVIDWYNNDTILKTVVFKVNMNQQIILGNFDPATDLVDIGANFNNYGEALIALSDNDNNGIYETTQELGLKLTATFKFRINSDWDSAELSGQSNRELTIGESNNTFTFWYDNNEPTEITTEVTSFSLGNQIKPCFIDADNLLITGEVIKSADLNNLIPVFSLSGQASAYISDTRILSGETSVDFSDTVIFTVLGMDGETAQDWKIAISKEKNTEAIITGFEVDSQTGNATINQENLSIEVEIKYGSDKTALTPTVTASENALVIPDGTTPIDFTNPVTYTVTSEDEKTINEYLVTVTVADTIYTGNSFVSYSIPEQTKPSIIDSTNHTISTEVYFGTDVTRLTPEFTISKGAQVSPTTATVTNFSEPVIYTVESQIGETIEWVATVTQAKNCATEILSFELNEEVHPATIDRNNQTIHITVKRLTDVSNLTPRFVLSPQAKVFVNNIEQISDTTTNDFTTSLIYHVIAGNDTCTQDWAVDVTVDKNKGAKLLSFTIDGADIQPWDTVFNIINMQFPESTNLSDLVAEFTISEGASIWVNETEQTSKVSANDFSSPVQYKIVSEDGLTETFWLVKSTFIAGLNQHQHNISIYPNPATDNININSNPIIKDIKVYNSIGLAVMQIQPNSKMINLNFTELPKGVYFIECVTLDNKHLRKKVIKN